MTQDSLLSAMIDLVLADNDEGEADAISNIGGLSSMPFSFAPNAPIKYGGEIAVTLIFGGSAQASNGDFTMRD